MVVAAQGMGPGKRHRRPPQIESKTARLAAPYDEPFQAIVVVCGEAHARGDLPTSDVFAREHRTGLQLGLALGCRAVRYAWAGGDVQGAVAETLHARWKRQHTHRHTDTPIRCAHGVARGQATRELQATR